MDDIFGGMGDCEIADGWKEVKSIQDVLAMSCVQLWWINWLLDEVSA